MMKYVYLLLTLFAGAGQLSAQPDMNEKRLEEFRKLTNQRVNDLQLYISLIGDKSLSLAQREQAVELAVSLFEKDYLLNGKRRSPYVQVSRRNGKISSVPVRIYFKNLMNVKFDKVEITYYDAAVVSEFEKGTDGNYHATATYYQQFKGMDAKGNLVYGSRDRKDIRVTAQSAAVYAQAGKEDMKIFFGDITVKDTVPIPGFP
ncbi:hypothetical protein LZD49_02930 [Dyadobacter sp. CY261]|uniref:hypothetical protein n=1 Tax=Dyadobacter sp. CY261 TaxID=2907203 RepID=UPI001F29988F|nr:hypothetical protein [Dyadobacter sp. CY261]MCF0069407.1 hypothetical protein [Dyadobacter sp. CY261]